MVHRRQWTRAVAGIFGVSMVFGPVNAASAESDSVIVPERAATSDARDFAVPADPPFNLPYERPDGPIGSGIYTVSGHAAH